MKDSYDSLDDGSSLSEHLLPSDEDLKPQRRRKKQWSNFIPWMLTTLLSVVLLVAIFVANRDFDTDNDLGCIKAQSVWCKFRPGVKHSSTR